jgi:hypothetical protein
MAQEGPAPTAAIDAGPFFLLTHQRTDAAEVEANRSPGTGPERAVGESVRAFGMQGGVVAADGVAIPWSRALHRMLPKPPPLLHRVGVGVEGLVLAPEAREIGVTGETA